MFIKFQYKNNLGKDSEGFISLDKVASLHFSKDADDKEMLLVTLPFSTHDFRDVNVAPKGNSNKVERKLMQVPYTIFISDADTIERIKQYLVLNTI